MQEWKNTLSFAWFSHGALTRTFLLVFFHSTVVPPDADCFFSYVIRFVLDWSCWILVLIGAKCIPHVPYKNITNPVRAMKDGTFWYDGFINTTGFLGTCASEPSLRTFWPIYCPIYHRVASTKH
jgi:hypothetical protein